MSIMIVRGPEEASRLMRGPAPLPRELLHQLVARAADVGKTVALRACGSEQELLDALRVAQQARIEVAVIDPGACAGNPRLHRVLAALDYPYVEAHDDGSERPEPPLPDGLGQRIASVHGYRAQSYTLALSIALEHLGCESAPRDIHVGT
ncbi:3-dehydroquinate dehydratase [Stenotrophomonas sp. HITSZ_GD]|uniref:3-dehydroquinate dehydratase n=1 Tax=Stenotrophomonas sp. HITSZ_GD TaxID=3037248 RepID=UPI00240D79B3|nr:3-dehydroquinate dehydratase [Stenotrophomonas sp. HITSZ_GD]MDG2525389.1 3-dehydroquinate dehydratase [Stenotrophomonas sp. HITSZ_GD]